MQTSLPTVPLNRGDKFQTHEHLFISMESTTSQLSVVKSAFLLILMIGVVSVSSVLAQNNTWKGASANWNIISNWSLGTVPTSSTIIVLPALTGSVKFNPQIPNGTTAVCKSISSMANNTSISAAGTGSLTISSTGTTSIASQASITCPITLAANTNTSFSVSAVLTITGPVNGTGNITKTGGGSMALGAAVSSLDTLSITGGTATVAGDMTLKALTLTGGDITIGGITTINNTLALNSGNLIISNGTLIANGPLTNAGGFLIGSSAGNIVLGGASAQSLNFKSTDTLVNSLTLNHSGNATTTLNSSMAISGGIIFSSSNDNLDLNGQHVTLHSDVNGTAYLGEIKGSLTNATNVSVERYMDRNQSGGTFIGSRGWRLMTIPVTGQTIRQAWAGVNANGTAPAGESHGYGTLITGHGYASGTSAAAAGFDWFTGLGTSTTSSIRYYTAANAWASATNTPSTLNLPGKQGYMLYVRGDRTVATPSDSGYATLNPTGTLKQGTQTIAVSDPFTVVGNPYASPLDLDAFYNNSGNSDVINQNFWLWDATLGTTGAYRSVSWNGVDAYDMIGGNGELATDYLIVNSGQAFFVERKAAGNVHIEESNKTTTAAQTMFRQMGASTVSNLSVKLYLASGATLGVQADGVVARYNNIYSISPNEIYDVAKMNNFNENLSLVRDGRYLSIESRPYPKQNDTLFMPFWGLSKRDYALTVTSNYLDGLNQFANLYDAFTNTTTAINMGSGATITYPFTITTDPASSSQSRFTIVMAPSKVLPVNFTNVTAAAAGAAIKINWSVASEQGTKSYDVEKSTDGTAFTTISNVAVKKSTTAATYQVMDDQPLPGINYYRIRSNDESGKSLYSSIVSVRLNAKKAIGVTPMVITDQHFTLTMTDQAAGNYNLQLTDLSGQRVFRQVISNTGGNMSQVISLSKGFMATGIYNLSVTGADGTNKNFRLLIKN